MERIARVSAPRVVLESWPAAAVATDDALSAAIPAPVPVPSTPRHLIPSSHPAHRPRPSWKYVPIISGFLSSRLNSSCSWMHSSPILLHNAYFSPLVNESSCIIKASTDAVVSAMAAANSAWASSAFDGSFTPVAVAGSVTDPSAIVCRALSARDSKQGTEQLELRAVRRGSKKVTIHFSPTVRYTSI